MSRWNILCLSALMMLMGSAWAMADSPNPGQMTWQDCLLEASRNHPDIIAAQEEILQQQAAKSITASSMLPQLTAGFEAMTSHSGSLGGSNDFNYGLSGSQLVFDGFKTANQVHEASANINAAQENFSYTSATVRYRLRVAFIAVLNAQETITLAQGIYKIRKDNLDLITLRYQSGMEHRGALLTAQAQLQEAQFDVDQAQRNLEVAQRQLTKELGRQQFFPVEVQEDLNVSDAAPQKPDFDALADKNPQVLEAAAQENAAAFGAKAAKGSFWPTVSLTGDLGKDSSGWPPRQTDSDGGVKVSLPIFEGGSHMAALAQAQSLYRQLGQEKRSTRDGVILNLEQTWSALQDAIENVKVQQSYLTADQERSKIAEEQYVLGLLTYDNWTIIEDNLVSAKKQFLNAQINALLAQANWVQAKGGTLEYEK